MEENTNQQDNVENLNHPIYLDPNLPRAENTNPDFVLIKVESLYNEHFDNIEDLSKLPGNQVAQVMPVYNIVSPVLVQQVGPYFLNGDDNQGQGWNFLNMTQNGSIESGPNINFDTRSVPSNQVANNEYQASDSVVEELVDGEPPNLPVSAGQEVQSDENTNGQSGESFYEAGERGSSVSGESNEDFEDPDGNDDLLEYSDACNISMHSTPSGSNEAIYLNGESSSFDQYERQANEAEDQISSDVFTDSNNSIDNRKKIKSSASHEGSQDTVYSVEVAGKKSVGQQTENDTVDVETVDRNYLFPAIQNTMNRFKVGNAVLEEHSAADFSSLFELYQIRSNGIQNESRASRNIYIGDEFEHSSTDSAAAQDIDTENGGSNENEHEPAEREQPTEAEIGNYGSVEDEQLNPHGLLDFMNQQNDQITNMLDNARHQFVPPVPPSPGRIRPANWRLPADIQNAAQAYRNMPTINIRNDTSSVYDHQDYLINMLAQSYTNEALTLTYTRERRTASSAFTLSQEELHQELMHLRNENDRLADDEQNANNTSY